MLWVGLLLLLWFPFSLAGQTEAEPEVPADEPVAQESVVPEPLVADELPPVQIEPQTLPMAVVPEPEVLETRLPPEPRSPAAATDDAGLPDVTDPAAVGAAEHLDVPAATAVEDTAAEEAVAEEAVTEETVTEETVTEEAVTEETVAEETVAEEAADTGTGDSEALETDAITELRISGASTIQPIIEALRDAFERETGVRLLVTGGGSGRGIRDVMEGTSSVGMVSRSLRDSEQADLRHTTFALDTLVFVVNAANPRRNITRSDLVALYTRADDWSQFAEGFDWPLHRVSKEVGRSTLDLFEEFTGLTSPDRPGAMGTLINPRSVVIGSNLEVATLVGGLRGGVGYLSLGAAASLRDQGLPIRVLDLGGVAPSVRTIESGQYPIRRELNLVYLESNPAIDALLALLGSPVGQQVIESTGFIATGGQ